MAPSLDHTSVFAPALDSASTLFVCLRNQTRILNLKSVLVSAPTGQMSTVLSE